MDDLILPDISFMILFNLYLRLDGGSIYCLSDHDVVKHFSVSFVLLVSFLFCFLFALSGFRKLNLGVSSVTK